MKTFEIKSTQIGLECYVEASGSLEEVKAWLADTLRSLEAFEKGITPKSTPIADANLLRTEGQEYFTASELAGFIGMPITARGVRRRAETHSWVKRRNKGQGGGWAYHISNFSPDVQDALRRHS